MRAQTSQLVEIYAYCHDCGATWESGNAQGLASQHAARRGHLVDVTVTRHYTYATMLRWRRKGPASA